MHLRGFLKGLLLFKPFYTRIDYLKTILLNFSCLPFKQAIKLPIVLYHNVKIITIGEIEIQGPIKTAMIKIGVNIAKSYTSTKILTSGKMIFTGSCNIASGVIIEGKGQLYIGNDVLINENCKIMCQHSITIGNHSGFGFDTTIMDTDYHFIVNTSTGEIKKNFGKVIIGEYCWISSNCKIMKGSRLPKGSIVVGNSLINKDFSNEPENCIFGGTPAKILKQGFKRLFNTNEERKTTRFFEKNPNVSSYNIDLKYFNSINNGGF